MVLNPKLDHPSDQPFPEFLAEFIERNRSRLAAVCLRRVRSQDVDDFLQLLWLQMREHEDKYDGDEHRFYLYCATALYRLILTSFRRGRIYWWTCYRPIDDFVTVHDRSYLFDELLEGLSDREKAVLNAYFVDGKTTYEIAHELNLSNDYVRQIKFRALEKLRRES